MLDSLKRRRFNWGERFTRYLPRAGLLEDATPFLLRSEDLEAISLRLRRFFSVSSNRRPFLHDSTLCDAIPVLFLSDFCFCLRGAAPVKCFRLDSEVNRLLSGEETIQAGWVSSDSGDGGMSSEKP